MDLLLTLIVAAGIGTTSRSNSPAANAGPMSTNLAAATERVDVPITDLKSALDFTSLGSSEPRMILAIGPDKISHEMTYTPDGQLEEDDALYPPRAGHSLNLGVVARFFDRRVVRLSTVAVIVSKEMVVLNTHLKEPNIYDGLTTYGKLQLLEASLTSTQWQALGSVDGLGLSDLSSRQQPLFASMLPKATAVVKTRYVIDERGESIAAPSGSEEKPLDDEALSKIRLRLDETSNITLLSAAGNHQISSGFVNTASLALERSYFQQTGSVSQADQDKVYGQPLRLRLPSKAKPSQIDFASPQLDVIVSVGDARTVGSLVNLVREKSGVDIYVDGRLAKIPVYLKGSEQGVRSGDLLQALCLALTGAIRKVGPAGPGRASGKDSDTAYVLTNDIEGLGARRAKIDAWANRAQREKTDLSTKQMATIAKQNPLQYLSTASDDPMAPTPEVMSEIEANWSAPHSMGASQADVPISQLSPVQREAVRVAVQRDIQYEQDQPRPGWVAPDPGKVRVSLMLGLTYVVPGFGTVRTGEAFMNGTLVPPDKRPAPKPSSVTAASNAAVPPAVVKDVILAVALKSREEIPAVFDTAKVKGIGKIWIRTADDREGREILTSAVESGKARGLPVFALLPLMQAPKLESEVPKPVRQNAKKATNVDSVPLAPNDALDLNLYGETGSVAAARAAAEPTVSGPFGYFDAAISQPTTDVLAPESEETLTLEADRINRIASIPDLSGICFTEVREPGHVAESEHAIPGQSRGMGDPTEEFGFTVANRLRFLRKHGYDPIDLPHAIGFWTNWQSGSATTLPYFDTDDSGSLQGMVPHRFDQDVVKAWYALRAEEQTTMLHNLYIRVRRSQPDIPMFISIGSNYSAFRPTTYRPWTDSESDADPATPKPAAALAASATTVSRGVTEAPTGHRIGSVQSYSFTSETLRSLRSVLSMFDETPGAAMPGRKGDISRHYPVVLDLTSLPLSDALAALDAALADVAK